MPADDPFSSVLSAARAGAAWAVADLYRRVNPAVLRYLRARAPRGDADDLASQTWIDAARNLRSFTGGEAEFRSWLFTIASRRMADEYRRHRRRPVELVPTHALATVPTRATVEEQADSGRLGDEAARRIVASLPPEQAEVVLLRVVGGLSVDDVARVTGHTPGNVRVIQHRALRRLAETLGDEV